jgi:hypothetical protein
VEVVIPFPPDSIFPVRFKIGWLVKIVALGGVEVEFGVIPIKLVNPFRVCRFI